MNITPNQKLNLSYHIAKYQKTNFGGKHYLIDGEVISFTNPDFRYRNVEFDVGNGRKIWYSQLATICFQLDMVDLISAKIKLKDGSALDICDIDFENFADLVEGKKFKIRVVQNTIYTVNRYSNTLNDTYNGTIEYEELRSLLHRCLEKNDFSDLGDIIKTTQLYDLSEV